jgi:AcrR family transcriptional regulator/DNA-binding MarR family transcriptional regulator
VEAVVTPRNANEPGARRRSGGEALPRERVSEVQRARMLMAARQVVAREGYARMSVERVVARAGVSRKTFYDLFENREDCFIAAFDDAVERVARIVGEAYAGETGWRERMRAGLAALLGVLDDEPELRTVCVVEALAAGPRVLEHRTRVLRALIAAVDEGRDEARKEAPPLAAEGVVGAVLAVIHARAVESGPVPAPEGNGSDRTAARRRPAPKPLSGLQGPLMGMIVLPYLGPAAADRELGRPAPRRTQRIAPRAVDALEGLDMRLTYRTLRVLSVLAQRPGASNRLVAEQAGVADQGQVSKLLMRLSNLGLIENSGDGHTKGAPNAWRLTLRGQDVENAIRIDTGAAG